MINSVSFRQSAVQVGNALHRRTEGKVRERGWNVPAYFLVRFADLEQPVEVGGDDLWGAFPAGRDPLDQAVLVRNPASLRRRRQPLGYEGIDRVPSIFLVKQVEDLVERNFGARPIGKPRLERRHDLGVFGRVEEIDHMSGEVDKAGHAGAKGNTRTAEEHDTTGVATLQEDVGHGGAV